MAGAKKPWHRGGYQRQARLVREAAVLDPSTRCMSCNRTLAEIRVYKPDAKWTAGHLVDSQTGGPLAPECSPCNYSRGASYGNAKRGRGLQTSRRW